MKAITSKVSIFIIVTVASFLVIGYAQEKPIDPVKMFSDKKCISCHSINVIVIAKTNEKSRAPDLSNVYEKGPDFLTKYLKKEAEIDGKKHGIAWHGTEDELKAMVGWLMSIRPAKNQ